MRLSPHRHTLAVLRTLLGLTQKEMAEIAERSRPTIQAIELGKLPLSFDAAQRIHFGTGVSQDWLMANDVTKAPVTDDGHPYTRAHFDERRAALLTSPSGHTDACIELWDVWSLFARHVRMVCVLYAEAYKKGKVPIAAYKSMMATVEVIKETIKPDDATTEKLMAGAGREVAPERLDEVAGMVREFTAETYEELKRKLKHSKKPLTPAARAFLRDYDKKLSRAAKK